MGGWGDPFARFAIRFRGAKIRFTYYGVLRVVYRRMILITGLGTGQNGSAVDCDRRQASHNGGLCGWRPGFDGCR